MVLSRHHLFLLALLLPLVSFADAIYNKCSENFTNNSILQENIKKVIYEFEVNAPSDGYAISIIGDGNNTVYGLTQCRGDIGTQACSNCIISAAQKLQEICPKSVASRIWYEFCFMRYDLTNFISNIDISNTYFRMSGRQIVDSGEFNSGLQKLLNWVNVNASLESDRFGMGEISILNRNLTIYGMAQCTHDLQGLICMKCLTTFTTWMTTYCKNRAGCYFLCSSCYLRYETYKFIVGDNIPVYPGSAALTPAPTPTPIPSTLV